MISRDTIEIVTLVLLMAIIASRGFKALVKGRTMHRAGCNCTGYDIDFAFYTTHHLNVFADFFLEKENQYEGWAMKHHLLQ